MSSTFVCIAGGGTAGHLLPGLAVAEALVDEGHARDSIHFVGSARGLEVEVVPAAGFPLTALPGRGIPRHLSMDSLRAALGVVKGVASGPQLMRRLRPRAVVVLGGYAAVPATVGAIVCRVPLVVMEQNARAGAANRLAARFATVSAVPFAETDLPRAVVTGNPVRPEIAQVARHRDPAASRRLLDLPAERTVIAVFTGSLGSARVNTAVRALVEQWRDRSDLAIHHVIGVRDWVEGDDPDLPADGLWYRRVRYEDRMPDLLAAADLAVCRAGGLTVAELAEVGVGAVLVPLPIATRDHQTFNAGPLVAAGATVAIPDDQLDSTRLAAELTPLLAEPGRLAAMGAAARTLAHPDAARQVAALVVRAAAHD